MNKNQAGNTPLEPNGAPGCQTESPNSIDCYDDGPPDLTVRPVPPDIPLRWYPRVPPKPMPRESPQTT